MKFQVLNGEEKGLFRKIMDHSELFWIILDNYGLFGQNNGPNQNLKFQIGTISWDTLYFYLGHLQSKVHLHHGLFDHARTSLLCRIFIIQSSAKTSHLCSSQVVLRIRALQIKIILLVLIR